MLCHMQQWLRVASSFHVKEYFAWSSCEQRFAHLVCHVRWLLRRCHWDCCELSAGRSWKVMKVHKVDPFLNSCNQLFSRGHWLHWWRVEVRGDPLPKRHEEAITIFHRRYGNQPNGHATQSQKLLDRHGYSGQHEEMDGFRERTRKSRDAREKLAGSLSGKTRQLITGALPGSLQSMKFHGNGEFQRHVNPAVNDWENHNGLAGMTWVKSWLTDCSLALPGTWYWCAEMLQYDCIWLWEREIDR